MKKNNLPSGSDVSAGTFECSSCGYKISIQSKTSLPPCSKCSNGSWNVCTGVGDAKADPYPKK